MTEKRKCFADEYTIDLNFTRAYNVALLWYYENLKSIASSLKGINCNGRCL
jgi:Terminase small subunit.